jgi:hypothetical protein
MRPPPITLHAPSLHDSMHIPVSVHCLVQVLNAVSHSFLVAARVAAPGRGGLLHLLAVLVRCLPVPLRQR